MSRGHQGDSPYQSSSAGKTASPIYLPVSEKPGDWIGRYKLLQKLGEGGCSVVYMAEQEEPVKRRVALKVIKLGMDTKEVIARFEAERQALALMDHTNIAKRVRLKDAIERLAQLYEAWSKPDKAGEWKAKLLEFQTAPAPEKH